MYRCVAMAMAVSLLLTVVASANIVIDTVPVGNPSNASDRHGRGYGAVGYAYRMGKFEVTTGQYCEFLNAVASNDFYGLYNARMADTADYSGCNIKQTGGAGHYRYSVAADWANRPVNFVSWGDAVRFANWLTNGQPTGALTGNPAQDVWLTEDGSYSLNGATSGADLADVMRRADAHYVVPTEDEWYKAAYHRNDGVTGSYWDYPTGTDAAPANLLVNPDPGNNANFYGIDYTIGFPYYRTDVGEFENSESPYGTFDQGGNVWEWNETVMTSPYGLQRGFRGGAYNTGVSYGLHAASRFSDNAAMEGELTGFRVAEVPEPGSLSLLALGGLAVMRRCVRRHTITIIPAIVSASLLTATTARAVNVETVPVGNPGNVGELSGAGAGGYGLDRICGSVGYTYNIGKYEVTAGQYKAFLDAVAGVDTYALYNTSMSSTSSGSGITRSGGGTVGDPYTYSVNAAFVNRPVNYVSWGDAARFANWLHNNQPTGAQGLSTTEDGAYCLNGATTNAQLLAVDRKAGWKWAIGSEDEWYKAAYYKGGSTNAGYWDFATSSNAVPGRDLNDVSGNNANYYGDPYPIQSPYYTTVTGEFQNSDSPYGTFDQGGNVWEWNEAVVGLGRGVRGGSFGVSFVELRAQYRLGNNPAEEYYSLGFRVAEVPEPAALPLLAVGCFVVAWGRNRGSGIHPPRRG